jgi:hypothetical protein
MTHSYSSFCLICGIDVEDASNFHCEGRLEIWKDIKDEDLSCEKYWKTCLWGPHHSLAIAWRKDYDRKYLPLNWIAI